VIVVVIIVASLAFAFVLGAILWTVGQGAARRARDRADSIVARDGIVATHTATVNLLGTTSLARTQIRGVGVLALTAATLEFRLGYGSTAISIPRPSIRDVSVGKTFSIRGRAKKMLQPWILTITWRDGDTEHTAGFQTREADAIAAWFTR
jgi:hypothetical protein